MQSNNAVLAPIQLTFTYDVLEDFLACLLMFKFVAKKPAEIQEIPVCRRVCCQNKEAFA